MANYDDAMKAMIEHFMENAAFKGMSGGHRSLVKRELKRFGTACASMGGAVVAAKTVKDIDKMRKAEGWPPDGAEAEPEETADGSSGHDPDPRG